MRDRFCKLRTGLTVALAAALSVAGLMLPACESTENGTTRTKSTKTVETPDERTTTTTTHERKVEDYPD